MRKSDIDLVLQIIGTFEGDLGDDLEEDSPHWEVRDRVRAHVRFNSINQGGA